MRRLKDDAQLQIPSDRRTTATDDVDTAVLELARLSLGELRTEWLRRLRRAPPRCRSKEVLLGLLAWAIQERAYGGLSATTKRQLKELAHSQNRDPRSPRREPPRLMPGTVLTREWRGVTHRVCVLEKGFAYEGKTFGDLSSIARNITGTRWSGPRFFGLKLMGERS